MELCVRYRCWCMEAIILLHDAPTARRVRCHVYEDLILLLVMVLVSGALFPKDDGPSTDQSTTQNPYIFANNHYPSNGLTADNHSRGDSWTHRNGTDVPWKGMNVFSAGTRHIALLSEDIVGLVANQAGATFLSVVFPIDCVVVHIVGKMWSFPE